MQSQAQRLVGIKHTAKLFGVSDHTVRAWVNSGRIASHKIFGRRMIAFAEIERLIRESECPRSSSPKQVTAR